MTRTFVRRLAGSIFLSVSVSAAGAGCTQLLAPNCTDELRVQLSPRDTTVSVGSTFTATVSLSTCGGRERLADTFTYASTNPAATTVNATTGRVDAVGVGQADIVITGQRYGTVGRARVTVSP